jgi:hypothetical protein
MNEQTQGPPDHSGAVDWNSQCDHCHHTDASSSDHATEPSPADQVYDLNDFGAGHIYTVDELLASNTSPLCEHHNSFHDSYQLDHSNVSDHYDSEHGHDHDYPDHGA